ncbi:uncharacterized protein TNCV_3896201 [Trichonephila clavipes]|nr:uncharacterized protein TNCV_3896201 [Trichonephila clavipes]
MLPNTLRVHTEYVLVKSVDPKVLWLNHECKGLDPFSSMPKLWMWRRWCRPLSSFRGVSPSKFVLSPVWCSRPTTGVLLAPCHDEFRGISNNNNRTIGSLPSRGFPRSFSFLKSTKSKEYVWWCIEG